MRPILSYGKYDYSKDCRFFEEFSFSIKKETFIVLDNASIHRAKIILSPSILSIAEVSWIKFKGEWIKPEDYRETDHLFHATRR